MLREDSLDAGNIFVFLTTQENVAVKITIQGKMSKMPVQIIKFWELLKLIYLTHSLTKL